MARTPTKTSAPTDAFPWFPVFVNLLLDEDFETLNRAEVGSVFLLMLHQWAKEGTLPKNPRKLANLAKCSLKELESLLAAWPHLEPVEGEEERVAIPYLLLHFRKLLIGKEETSEQSRNAANVRWANERAKKAVQGQNAQSPDAFVLPPQCDRMGSVMQDKDAYVAGDQEQDHEEDQTKNRSESLYQGNEPVKSILSSNHSLNSSSNPLSPTNSEGILKAGFKSSPEGVEKDVPGSPEDETSPERKERSPATSVEIIPLDSEFLATIKDLWSALRKEFPNTVFAPKDHRMTDPIIQEYQDYDDFLLQKFRAAVDHIRMTPALRQGRQARPDGAKQPFNVAYDRLWDNDAALLNELAAKRLAKGMVLPVCDEEGVAWICGKYGGPIKGEKVFPPKSEFWVWDGHWNYREWAEEDLAEGELDWEPVYGDGEGASENQPEPSPISKEAPDPVEEVAPQAVAHPANPLNSPGPDISSPDLLAFFDQAEVLWAEARAVNPHLRGGGLDDSSRREIARRIELDPLENTDLLDSLRWCAEPGVGKKSWGIKFAMAPAMSKELAKKFREIPDLNSPDLLGFFDNAETLWKAARTVNEYLPSGILGPETRASIAKKIAARPDHAEEILDALRWCAEPGQGQCCNPVFSTVDGFPVLTKVPFDPPRPYTIETATTLVVLDNAQAFRARSTAKA